MSSKRFHCLTEKCPRAVDPCLVGFGEGGGRGWGCRWPNARRSPSSWQGTLRRRPRATRVGGHAGEVAGCSHRSEKHLSRLWQRPSVRVALPAAGRECGSARVRGSGKAAVRRQQRSAEGLGQRDVHAFSARAPSASSSRSDDESRRDGGFLTFGSESRRERPCFRGHRGKSVLHTRLHTMQSP